MFIPNQQDIQDVYWRNRTGPVILEQFIPIDKFTLL